MPTLPTIHQALSLMRKGDLTATELIERCLRNIESSDPDFGAWVQLDAEAALRSAGDIRPGDARPLAGIPIGIKDVIDVGGMYTRAGSAILEQNLADADAPVVSALRHAGAIILGKTRTHEFAYGFVTPGAHNPRDTTRITGGSSGGSAAALAAEHCLGALGTDTGGSVRVPAALCGVVGLKPLQASVPLDGIIALAPTMDCVGPMGRTSACVAALWDAISKGRSPSEEGDHSLIIGVPTEEALGQIDDQVQMRFQEAVHTLETTSKIRWGLPTPRFEEFIEPRAAMLMPQALAYHRARGWWPDRMDDYTDEIRSNLMFTERQMTAASIEQGVATARRLIAALMTAFEEIDLIATPTVPVPAPISGEQIGVDGEGRRPMARLLSRLVSPVNMAGLAAITLPCGVTSEGLPVGLQLIGRNEAVLISLARRFEER